MSGHAGRTSAGGGSSTAVPVPLALIYPCLPGGAGAGEDPAEARWPVEPGREPRGGGAAVIKIGRQCDGDSNDATRPGR